MTFNVPDCQGSCSGRKHEESPWESQEFFFIIIYLFNSQTYIQTNQHSAVVSSLVNP